MFGGFSRTPSHPTSLAASSASLPEHQDEQEHEACLKKARREERPHRQPSFVQSSAMSLRQWIKAGAAIGNLKKPGDWARALVDGNFL